MKGRILNYKPRNAVSKKSRKGREAFFLFAPTLPPRWCMHVQQSNSSNNIIVDSKAHKHATVFSMITHYVDGITITHLHRSRKSGLTLRIVDDLSVSSRRQEGSQDRAHHKDLQRQQWRDSTHIHHGGTTIFFFAMLCWWTHLLFSKWFLHDWVSLASGHRCREEMVCSAPQKF